MPASHEFLQNFALVLVTAAAVTVIFKRLKQPVIFGYIVAGLLIGPHVPLIPLIADEGTVRTLSEVGVILLMFSLGLEFSLRKLARVAGTAGVIAPIETSVMVWLGFSTAQLFGWSTLESIYAGAIIAISSTTIIIKAFEEENVRGRFTEIVFGVLIVEDLIAIFLLAVLTSVSAGTSLSLGSVAATGARLGLFLGAVLGLGIIFVPRVLRYIVHLDRPETTVVATTGLAFAVALLALQFGYSVALGAFIAGALAAESGEERVIEPLIQPVRDVFAAIFFVSVGMLIDPVLISRYWPAIAIFTVLVIGGKVIALSLSTFFTGATVRTAVHTGMSMGQIGEFSFIIAGVGLATGATRDFLFPIAVTVSAITTLTTPLLLRASGDTAAFVDRKLPHSLQTFVALYGSWLDRLRAGGTRRPRRSRRLIRLMVLDAGLLLLFVIGMALEFRPLHAWLQTTLTLSPEAARMAVLAGAILVAAPLIFGLIRTSQLLALELASTAITSVEPGRMDAGAAPRRALAIALHLGILIIVGGPIVAITQPFLPPLRGAAILLVLVIGLGIAFWRSTTNLQGHARAGAQVMASAFGKALQTEHTHTHPGIEQMHRLLPGLGEPVPLVIGDNSRAAGKTLSALNVRGLTGATVLAILRTGDEVLLPTGREVLQAGDTLVMAGSQEAIRAAEELLSA